MTLVWSFSCLINAFVFGGRADECVSARAYREAVFNGCPVWRRRWIWIDRIFFFDPNHCRENYLDEQYENPR